MKKLITFVLLLAWSMVNGQWSMAQIGTWKAYMAYSDIQEIQKAGDELFVMASNDLYQYNINDQSIYTYDKTNGLSDTYIRHIKWCPAAKRLIVVYQNSNIDLVETDGNVINISDLYTKVITGDKSVNSIRIDDVYAYLICGFGIVKVNMERAEISDSYTPNHPEYPTNLPAEDNSDYDQYIEVVKKLNPGGPKYNHFGFIRSKYHNLYCVNGIMEQKASIQVLNNSKEWTIFETDIEDKIGHRFVGLTGIDVNPQDTSNIIISGQTGVYVFKDGKFIKEYTNDNSLLQTAKTVSKNNKNYVIVSDGVFDDRGNYWCVNSVSPSTSLLELTNSGEWVSHHSNDLMLSTGWSMDDMRSMFFSADGSLWFTNNYFRTPALIKYNTTTDGFYIYNNFINQDNTPLAVNAVHCAREDKENNIWVGTNTGLLVLEKSTIDSGLDNFIQVKVPRNDGTDYADYLLGNLNITCIAIDGGNRKWIGTQGNGVYMISADNMEQVHHFTKENSPLLSDDILSLTINNKTGEVFFGTEYGLCSYISDAIEPAESMDNNDDVYAYPNPVDFNNYSGLITVTGLTYNADVKITNAAGFLIAEGRSNGGLFTWDGKDKKGNRVASGVYSVITATQDGKKGTVCKIAVIK